MLQQIEALKVILLFKFIRLQGETDRCVTCVKSYEVRRSDVGKNILKVPNTGTAKLAVLGRSFPVTAIATVALSQFLFAPVYASGVDGLQSGGRLFPSLPLNRIKYATFERGWECVSFHLFDFPACLFCEGAKTGRKGRMAGTVYCARFLAHSFDGSGFYARRSPLAQRAIVKMQRLVGELVTEAVSRRVSEDGAWYGFAIISWDGA